MKVDIALFEYSLTWCLWFVSQPTVNLCIVQTSPGTDIHQLRVGAFIYVAPEHGVHVTTVIVLATVVWVGQDGPGVVFTVVKDIV